MDHPISIVMIAAPSLWLGAALLVWLISSFLLDIQFFQ